MSQSLASISVSQSFQNLLGTVVHFIPKIVVFVAILDVGWIIAKVLARMVGMVLHRVKFDQFVKRGVVRRSLARAKTDPTALIVKIVYYMILLVTLQLAFLAFGPNPISTMLNGVVAWLPRAIAAIVVIVIASAIAKVAKDLINGAIGGLSYGPFLAGMASIVIIALGVVTAINQVGIGSAITHPLLYTVLFTSGAVVAIGVGGGLTKPMQERWERMLTAAERETDPHTARQQGRTDTTPAPQHAGRSQSPGSQRPLAPAPATPTDLAARRIRTTPRPPIRATDMAGTTHR